MTLPLNSGVMLMTGTPHVWQKYLFGRTSASKTCYLGWGKEWVGVPDYQTYRCTGVPLSVSGSWRGKKYLVRARRHISGDFAAVGTVAQMAAALFAKEVVVVDLDGDGWVREAGVSQRSIAQSSDRH
ncbi:uncharacterized protein PV07_11595 [Cladophialophora immunda]|uniref:Uncharacterized protein n=1 Tax=Cladophialophora immunda TaxID=569365 RepID=A0A0D1Z706_9EURO|nr:uncharacterized protein PV07_11595 [Cladophialophora immunda]KIW23391.1 hypothetical protein PV07_11595 [Cladophialophora immunda]